jgi:phosphate-selective porin OprO and OprP
MNLLKRCISVVFLPILITFCSIQIQAQSDAPASERPQRQADSHKDPSPPDDLELLKSKVNQLEKLVEQQQRLLTAMERRLGEVEGKNSAEPASAKSIAEAKVPDSPPVTSRSINIKPSPTATSKTAKEHVNQPVAGWGNRPFLQNEDGSATLNFIGGMQLDYRGYQAGDHPPDTFLVRRMRLGVEGKLAKYFDYRILTELADTRSTLVRDAFISIHRTDKFQLRFGQFKQPFGQEELLSYSSLDFVERSMADNLVPSRSPGIMAFGFLNQGTVEYYVGAFNGKGIQTPNNTDTPEGNLRLRFTPWKNRQGSLFKNFAFGGAFSSGRDENGDSIIGQTESRSFTFYKPELVNGQIIRANGELSWILRQAAIRAEYDQVNQEREGLGINGVNLPGIVSKAFMTQFTYVVTGEHKAENGAVIPSRQLFGNEGQPSGFGAWELKARFARLQISDSTAKSNHAESIYFGANWYLNRFVKYVLDFGIERFNDPLRSPNPKDKNYFVTLSRIQFSF